MTLTGLVWATHDNVLPSPAWRLQRQGERTPILQSRPAWRKALVNWAYVDASTALPFAMRVRWERFQWATVKSCAVSSVVRWGSCT